MDPNYQAPISPAPPVSKSGKFKNRFGKLKPTRKHSGLFIFIIVVAVIGGGAFIYQKQHAKPDPNNILGATAEDQAKENDETIKKVGEMTLIPADETPEIATIEDVTKLDEQAFFDRAQNGDKVIIYRTAKRVVLYRPSTNQVIETGPLVEPTTAP